MRRRRPRHWLILVAASIFIAAVAGALSVMSWKHGGGDFGIARDSDWQPPPQTLLASPMDVRPVAGWISRFASGDEAILIGNLLFVDEPSGDTGTQQYDLQTGVKGRTCSFSLSGYIASDSKVGVFEDGNPNIGLVARGIDLATCDVLWQIGSPIGSLRDVWRVNTTLVQLSDDATELTSLVAPN